MTQRIVFAVAALVMVALSAWLGWRAFHPQEKACARSAQLCKPADPERAHGVCRELLADLQSRRGGGIERMAADCMIHSESCDEALSCLSHADRRANELKAR